MKHIPDDRHFAIIMRHAQRDAIIDIRDALMVPLNPEGIKAARKLGTEMQHLGKLSLYHSPVYRCQETAESMVDGLANESSVVGPMDVLGGPYVKGEWSALAHEISREGMLPFVRKWFDNKIDSDLMHPLEYVAELKINYLREMLSRNISTIHVTHDWNILILREYFFGLKHEDLGNPDFMDGIICYQEGNSMILKYHQHTVKI